MTIDPRISGQMWLMADYLQELADLDDQIFPWPERICEWLGHATEIEVVPTSRDTSSRTWNETNTAACGRESTAIFAVLPNMTRERE